MTFQIVLISAIEEGPVRSSTSRLPNAYETFACARAVANRLIDVEYAADDARIVVWGTNEPAFKPLPAGIWADDELPF